MTFLNIVLVKSKYPRNVGLISRIMANFAVERLILVNPQCEMDEEARQGAAQGQGPLAAATIYPDWQAFYANEPDGLRIAFSRRQGRRRPSASLAETLSLDIIKPPEPVYLIFGAEDHGLAADDLENVHRLTHYELPGELQSMNLSHAVLVAVQSFYEKLGIADQNLQPTPASKFKDPEPYLKEWLEQLNFDLESHKRWNALKMLKQLIMKAGPSDQELSKFEMIVQQTIRRLKE